MVHGVGLAAVLGCLTVGAVERANLANYAGRDHLGRPLVSAAEADPCRPARQVGLFYHLWLGQHGTQGPYDISRIEAADPRAGTTSRPCTWR